MPVILPRPGEAGYKTHPNRVFTDAEHYRNSRGRSLGRERYGVATEGYDDGHATADQVRQQRRQTIVLTFQPMLLDRHVLTFDVAGVAETCAECAQTIR
jgi:hypothetical protein